MRRGGPPVNIPGDFIDLAVAVARLSEQIVRLDGRIDNAQSLTDSKFVTIKAQLESEARRVELALAASDKAISKSEQSYDKRFELLNELRSGVATTEQLDGLMQRLDDLRTRMDRSEGHGAGTKDNKAGLYAAIGAVGIIVTIVISIVIVITSTGKV